MIMNREVPLFPRDVGCKKCGSDVKECSLGFMPLLSFVPLVVGRILSTVFPYSLILSNFNKGIRENREYVPLLLRELSINKGRVFKKIDLHLLHSTRRAFPNRIHSMLRNDGLSGALRRSAMWITPSKRSATRGESIRHRQGTKN
jgi:hypothetical protein